mmetsp:Transcript_5605/g.7362  ORF Transcript_5605/g.7362 Transcript_5605/m.7362 type:complete len:86 (+) Transcript_5605:164-421(+)
MVCGKEPGTLKVDILLGLGVCYSGLLVGLILHWLSLSGKVERMKLLKKARVATTKTSLTKSLRICRPNKVLISSQRREKLNLQTK